MYAWLGLPIQIDMRTDLRYLFVKCLHTRTSFKVEFVTMYWLKVKFENHTLYIDVFDFEKLIGYAFMHIDDVL